MNYLGLPPILARPPLPNPSFPPNVVNSTGNTDVSLCTPILGLLPRVSMPHTSWSPSSTAVWLSDSGPSAVHLASQPAAGDTNGLERFTPANDYFFQPVDDTRAENFPIGVSSSNADWPRANFNDSGNAIPVTRCDVSELGDFAHGRIQQSSQINCFDCGSFFAVAAALREHAHQTQHKPYSCFCGEKFSRSDCLDRHIRTFQSTSHFPCPYCEKHQGSKAFSRRDHLLQHLQGHHRMDLSMAARSLPPPSSPRRRKKTPALSCAHADCVYHQKSSAKPTNVSSPFQTQRDLTKHLREAHNESPYPCTEIGCSRVDGRGFFRKADLLNHKNLQHPRSDPPLDFGLGLSFEDAINDIDNMLL